ncbi:DUF2490 domain-containing protein [Hugenholtzia roseola]|uniref:DUF2490 domain-containing protein n=1 Tax=Hugenholtzia roseola TaxID=1002 RepID=UPI0006883825|nr:DUF2490 domain-containing protein [Hugenholtzia roseola]
MKKIALLILYSSFFYACFFPLKGQDRSVASLEETGIWSGVYLKFKLSDKLGYYGEHHWRVRNSLENTSSFIGRKRQLYNRAGLNIFFSPYFEAVIGPTLVLNYSPNPQSADYEKVTVEPRIWHQWLFLTPALGRVKIYHQFRFEHRWKRANNIGAPLEYTNRYRYKFFAYIPINKKKITEKTLYFSPSAEIFLHSGKSIVYHPFEDFRTYNGFGYVLNSKITFFAGHMWTIGQKKTGFEYRNTHIIRLNVLIGLDFRSIEKRLPNINIGY